VHPGEYILDDGEVELNAGHPTAQVVVRNQGDRPIQVGSHYHFFEANSRARFRSRGRLWHAPRHPRWYCDSF